MSDQSHVDALADAESRAGSARHPSHTSGFSWTKIITVSLVLAAVAIGAYLMSWPAFYVGDVQWDADYSTLTLVDSGDMLSVTDDSQIVSANGDNLTVEFLRGLESGPAGVVFSARVVYRPYWRPRESSDAIGWAQTIVGR